MNGSELFGYEVMNVRAQEACTNWCLHPLGADSWINAPWPNPCDSQFSREAKAKLLKYKSHHKPWFTLHEC